MKAGIETGISYQQQREIISMAALAKTHGIICGVSIEPWRVKSKKRRRKQSVKAAYRRNGGENIAAKNSIMAASLQKSWRKWRKLSAKKRRKLVAKRRSAWRRRRKKAIWASTSVAKNGEI
jgi:hypothetical protein